MSEIEFCIENFDLFLQQVENNDMKFSTINLFHPKLK